MKLPSTSSIIAGLTAIVAPVIALLTSTNTVHWTTPQTTVVFVTSAASIAFIGAAIEHTRPGTPSRWPAVAGLLPPLVISVFATLSAFHVYTAPAPAQNAVLAIISITFGIFGIQVAQAKVFAPETVNAMMKAKDRSLGDGTVPGGPPAWSTAPSPTPVLPEPHLETGVDPTVAQ